MSVIGEEKDREIQDLRQQLEGRDAHFVRLSNIVAEMQGRLNEKEEQVINLQIQLGMRDAMIEERGKVIHDIRRAIYDVTLESDDLRIQGIGAMLLGLKF